MITYISIDIETDGPLIGVNSMLSLGAAAFSLDYQNGYNPLSKFEVNLEPLPSAIPDQTTMEEFWSKFPEAYKIATTNQKPSAEAILDFIKWYNDLPGEKIMVGYPSCFDFAWLRHYTILFTGKDILKHEALDIKSLAAAVLKKPFNQIKTSRMPSNWRVKSSRAQHKAVDDAVDQGLMLMNILREIKLGSQDCIL